MHCSCCELQKHTLKPRKSRLIKSMTLYVCESCEKAKMEPRYIIILSGRANGVDSVSDFIKNHRYSGKPILAEELMK